jgi:hypothetical protein
LFGSVSVAADADDLCSTWLKGGSISLLGVVTYGPIASWLVELFPARIRYTSMSLPYHLGNGWFGGFLPSIAFALIAYTGNIYSGLWYPVIVCLVTVVVGTFFLRETRGVEATDCTAFRRRASRSAGHRSARRRLAAGISAARPCP